MAPTNTSKANSSTPRRKTEIKKVEENNKRHVTFSKRKLGLFNKVTELSILCQAETALIVTSQNGKLFACGYPSPDAVIDRFLAEGSPSKHTRAGSNKQKEFLETLRVQYEAAQEILKEEKKRRDAMEANKAIMGYFPCWWENSIDEKGLEELKQFRASLEHLKMNLMATMEVKRVDNPIHHQPMVSFPSMLPMQEYSNYSPNFDGGLSTKQEQAWDWRNSGIASSSGSNNSVGIWDWRNNNGIVSSGNNTWDWRNNAIANSSVSSSHPNVYFGH